MTAHLRMDPKVLAAQKQVTDAAEHLAKAKQRLADTVLKDAMVDDPAIGRLAKREKNVRHELHRLRIGMARKRASIRASRMKIERMEAAMATTAEQITKQEGALEKVATETKQVRDGLLARVS